VTFYNDSKSTTPEATVTALHAMETPTLLVLGGYDKGVDLSAAARLAAQRAKYVACIGHTGPALAGQILAGGGAAEVHETLAQAVAACRRRAAPGDAVLLSPGCASYDMFENYTARGEEFSRLARGEPQENAASTRSQT
jgi:UDP-N-acetylmuramoylalanine--D-glutamate ligase